MKEVIEMLSGLGDDALAAFIVYWAVDLIEFLVFMLLVSWGVRSAFRFYKEQETKNE